MLFDMLIFFLSYSALAGACKYIIGGSKKKINTEDLTGKERIMWVIFVLSATAFGLSSVLTQ